MSIDTVALTEFADEMRAVQEALTAAAEELGMPLGELVRAQAKHSAPALCAALVLTVAYVPLSGETGRSRRVYLASALEMLTIALHVHRLLVVAANQEGQTDLDKAFIGSTILAGDYCFSRAASLAVQTDSPRVVTLFAQALQTISEGHLRAHSDPDGRPFDENLALLLSGAEAALELAELPAHLVAAQRSLALELAEALAQPGINTPRLSALLAQSPPDRRHRWQALLHWLMGERANGWSSPRLVSP